MGTFFGDSLHFIKFIHAMSGIFLLGSLIFLQIYIKPILNDIHSPAQRYKMAISFIGKFWAICTISTIALFSLAKYINTAQGYTHNNPILEILMNIVSLLFLFKAIIFGWIYLKYREIKKLYLKKDYTEIHENVVLIFNYLSPLLLGIAALMVYFLVMIET